MASTVILTAGLFSQQLWQTALNLLIPWHLLVMPFNQHSSASSISMTLSHYHRQYFGSFIKTMCTTLAHFSQPSF